jgi:hypothetical protein
LRRLFNYNYQLTGAIPDSLGSLSNLQSMCVLAHVGRQAAVAYLAHKLAIGDSAS